MRLLIVSSILFNLQRLLFGLPLLVWIIFACATAEELKAPTHNNNKEFNIKQKSDCQSITVEYKDALSPAVDPHFISEGYVAYQTAHISLNCYVDTPGDFRFDLKFSTLPAEKGSGGGRASNDFRLSLSKKLDAGTHNIQTPITIKDLSNKKGLLWAFRSDGQTRLKVTLLVNKTREQLIVEMGDAYQKNMQALMEMHISPEILAELNRSPETVLSLLASKEFIVSGRFVERIKAR